MSYPMAPSKPGTAAAKGAVPPEGWGRECEGGTTEHEGTSPYHASCWRAFCIGPGFCVLACKKHDSSAAEGGQPGGAPMEEAPHTCHG